MSALETIKGLVVDKDLNPCGIDDDTDVIGLYFSAHWCPPCRNFTPTFAEYFKKHKEAGKKLDVVFVSCDRDVASFKSYFGTMPWKALKFDAQEEKKKLMEKFEVSGIPALVFLDSNGDLITKEGRECVTEGKYPK